MQRNRILPLPYQDVWRWFSSNFGQNTKRESGRKVQLENISAGKVSYHEALGAVIKSIEISMQLKTNEIIVQKQLPIKHRSAWLVAFVFLVTKSSSRAREGSIDIHCNYSDISTLGRVIANAMIKATSRGSTA
ncbi:unnamed protein product [Timema podura]|uniref:Uncharacterized protein n=1 Tax=Timema podura TaxID=61482 RepID=A0ABN7NRN5_TIMPD|nr:unnamed protein product [Timema podura]